ncbi:MAG TPA: hypothetical protein VMF67_04630 [Rhizomicrobium sp.]|nr:hypothetical protein [Rhizomicrobium sp.]
MLDTIRKEWDQAEEDIKLAEQVCNDIIVPAVKELRYGGRRLIDLIQKIITDPTSPEVPKLLADAEFDCHRARHDAIDAGSAKIAIQLEIMVEKLTYEVILAVYPEFRQLALQVLEVRQRIVESRRNRTERQKIYAVIETARFPELVGKYNEMRVSEPIMRAMAKRSRWRDFYGKWGFLIGVAGFAIAIVGIYLAYHPPR